MKITLTNMYGNRHVDCEIDPNKPFIEIFDEFRQELNSSTIQKDEIRMQMLEYATLPNIKPSIHTDVIYPRTEFDFWKTPMELGVSDGAEIWLNRDTVFTAGILPLNALYYHFDELKKFLKEQHKGLQCAILYTDADQTLLQFMEKHLASEIVGLSGNIIVYAPIKNLFQENDSEFKDWWEKEYKDSSLVSSLDKIGRLILSTNNKGVYELVRKLKLSEDMLPCLVFFDNDQNRYVALRFSNIADEYKLLLTLRQVFAIANKVNQPQSMDKLLRLEDELHKFEKSSKEKVNNFPITIFSFSLIDMKGIGLLDSIFQSLGK